MNWIEWTGYAASLMVMISILMTSLIKLRWYNLIGAAFFVAYGIFIEAYPVAIVNFFITLINIYYLIKMSKTEEYFDINTIPAEDNYVKKFIAFHKDDIAKYFPNYKVSEKSDECFLLLKNMQVAGIFLGKRKNSDTLDIQLDYTLPEYRDFKLGYFLFQKNKKIFTDKSYKILSTDKESKKHNNYLQKMGFTLVKDKYIKTL
ncbi:MAG: hypothetical protein U9R32_06650 [Bacteroidota bacterium]|nr:hypothetical protein [Bacteroidota bacterium]